MRFYEIEIDGKPAKLPSVTSLLPPPFLVQWSANCAVEHILKYGEGSAEVARTAWKVVSEKAKNIGIEVHKNIESLLKDKILFTSETPEVNTCMEAFEQFIKDCDGYRTISTEEVVNTDRWAGTRDWCVELVRDGVADKYCVDFKSSKALYTDNRIQVTAYASIGGYRPALLRLDKEGGGYEFKTWGDKLSRKYMRIFEAYVKHYYDMVEAKGGK